MAKQAAKIRVYIITPDKPPKGWKASMGTIGWKGDELFIPACAAGMSNVHALLCLGCDGTPACWAGDVLLIPEKWARRECPAWRDVYDAIRNRALDMKNKP